MSTASNSVENNDVQSGELRSRFVWVGLILALLGGQAILLLVMVVIATSGSSLVVEPDYYQKGLNWEQHQAQQQANERLGWTLQIEVGDTADVLGQRTLACILTDRDGQPVDGAAVDGIAFSHSQGDNRKSFSLLPQGDGRYESTLRMSRGGLWEFRFVVKRGPDVFTHTEVHTLAVSGRFR